MEFRQLKYFVAVAEEMHFNRASQRLHIAQPALSQQIQSLESQLKTKLFNRTTRKVELTEAGAALLPVARNILAAVDNATRTVEKAALGIVGTLRLGFVSSAAVNLIPKVMDGMKRKWPQIDIELQEATTAEIFLSLRRNQLDIGLVREIEHYPDEIEVVPLIREPLVVAVYESHPLAGHQSIALKDLSGEKLISFRERDVAGLFDHIDHILRLGEVECTKGQEAIQLLTIIGLVAAQLGVAIVPQSLVVMQIPGVRYLRLSDEIAYSTIAVAHRAADSSNLLVRNCLDVARRVVDGD